MSFLNNRDEGEESLLPTSSEAKPLSIEEEMEELVPELAGSVSGGKKRKWKSNSSSGFLNNLLRGLVVLFAVFVVGFGAYILASSPQTIDRIERPSSSNTTSNTAGSEKKTSNTPPKAKERPTKYPKATYRSLPQLSGYMSHTYKWISNPLYPDGSYLDHTWEGIVLDHVEYKNATLIAQKSDFVLPETGESVHFGHWTVSYDLSYVLLSSNAIDGWRHSFFADYYLFNVQTRQLKQLNNSVSDKFIPHEKGSGKISNTIWSPTGHNLAWVRDNDIFVTIDGQTEIRVTTDGSKDIINGISDWVYEEEVLAEKTASWFSEDGKNLAFVKFDDSDVLEYELQYYSKFGETSYPTLIDIKYPKSGTPNPIATLHIASLTADGKSMPQQFVNFGDDGFDLKDRIVTQVNWVGSDSLLVRMMNRVQDHQKLYLISRPPGSQSNVEWKVKLVRDEKTQDGAWIQHLQPLRLIKPTSDSKSKAYSYIEISDLNKDQYFHLAFYESLESATPTHWITSGTWDVAAITRIDPYTGTIYYLSCEKGSIERHLYSVTLDGKQKKLLSSNGVVPPKIVDQVEGSLGLRKDAAYFNAEFSPSCTYYVLAYLGPDAPWERLQKTTDVVFGTDLSTWEFTRNTLSKISLPRVKYLTVPNDNGDLMNIKLIVPADFDDSGATKYPVLFQVYGGPNSQMVSMTYEVNYMHRLACLGMISMVVDVRGTGFQGRKYRAAVSTRLGELEAIDQVAAAKWAASQPFIDGKRIGIWGWSYGGYLTSKVIETNSGVFALGVAVAPVTDWKFYDTVYTERFMKTPQMNPEGYKKSAVANMEGFKNSKFLVMHGTADDNVHFQNSAELVWHLTGAHVTSYNVQFYTDSDHSINENGAHPQVYEKLTNFVCSEYGMECNLK